MLILMLSRRNELIEENGIQFDFRRNVVYLNGTKTKKSIRVIPLFESLRKELKQQRNLKQYFLSFKPDNVTRLFRKHCLKVGLKGFCVHSLRTTFATRCFEADVKAITIQNWLGHSKLETTTDIYVNYSSVSSNFILEEKEKFNNFFK